MYAFGLVLEEGDSFRLLSLFVIVIGLSRVSWSVKVLKFLFFVSFGDVHEFIWFDIFYILMRENI